MNREALESRLSRISTHWGTVLAAHSEAEDRARPAQMRMLDRYRGVVYRYLVAAVGNPDVAEDLSQEFAIRFLRGDFRKVHPDRGRFRNYIKTVLINLVNDHHRARNKWPDKLASDFGGPQPLNEEEQASQFVASCREEILDRTWSALEKTRLNYHAALRLRVEQPDLTSREMAIHLSETLDKDINPAWVRKTLERAHAKFADLLLDETASGLESISESDLAAELEELDLLKYCRSALERRRGKAK